MPSFDSGDDFAWVLGPGEGLGIDVRSGEKACNGGLQFGHRAEYAALEPLARQLGEVSLDGIEPGGGCWREVEGPAGVLGEPLAHLWMLVGGIVVSNGMDRLALRNRGFDSIEEADEFLMAVARHAAADDLAVQH